MRFFENKFADFKPEAPVQIAKSKWHDNVVAIVKTIDERMPPEQSTCDGGLYVGNAGVGYMLWYLANHGDFTSEKDDYLEKAMMYAKTNLDFTKRGGFSRDPPPAFVLGQAGIIALCSIIYKTVGDEKMSDKFLRDYANISETCKKIDFFRHGSDELLVGRAGYLSGVLTLQQKIGKKVLDDDRLFELCRATIESGQKGAKKQRSAPKAPLMYSYYDTEYLGAAHGLAGIIQMQLGFPEFLGTNPAAAKLLRESVDFMLQLEQPNGNFPPAMDEVGHARPESSELVHWCHGAPGVVYMLARAYRVFNDQKYLDACLRCGELTWKKGLLKKGPGICHGVAGSGYVFLLLYRLTGDHKHLYRAQKFAEFLFMDEFQRHARTPDSPFSLYEGWAGTVCFLADLMQPDKAEFPFFNVIF